MSAVTKLLPALGLAAGLFAAGQAQAITLTFDTPGSFNPYIENGMTITPILGSSAVTVSGGAWSLGCCNQGNYDFEFTTGGTFDLQSIVFLHSDAGDPITFRGFVGAAEVVSQVVNGNNVGLVNFAGFTGLDRVTFNAAGTFRDPSMDNLVYETSSAVPEPATLALLGAGLLGLGVLRRQRAV